MNEPEEAYEVKIVGRKEPLGFDRAGDARRFCRDMRKLGAKATYRRID